VNTGLKVSAALFIVSRWQARTSSVAARACGRPPWRECHTRISAPALAGDPRGRSPNVRFRAKRKAATRDLGLPEDGNYGRVGEARRINLAVVDLADNVHGELSAHTTIISKLRGKKIARTIECVGHDPQTVGIISMPDTARWDHFQSPPPGIHTADEGCSSYALK